MPIKAATGWVVPSLVVVAFGVFLALFSARFGYDFDVSEMPVIELTVGLVLAGLGFCFLPRLIFASDYRGNALRFALSCVFVAGLAARLALVPSEPVLEDDYQRYLWDGAVTASGHNPYALAPVEVRGQESQDGENDLARLAEESDPVIGRINHPDLRTIYPPVAQAAFALAHKIAPWSLVSLRSVLLVFDIATFVLIVLLLREVGRSPLWAALYWWNPLVIKELFNSAHMEAVLFPFVLAALFLAIRSRHVLAAASLAVAAGAKIWPVLLLPLVLRGSTGQVRNLVVAVVVFAGLMVLWAAPVLLAGFDSSSGFVAYASRWDTNSALFPTLEHTTAFILSFLTIPAETAGTLVRGAIAIGLGVLAIAISSRPIEGPDDLLGRASLVVAALVLFSPAQFPWYTTWIAPFLPFRPWFGFLLLTATAPLYYLGFYFFGQQRPDLAEVVAWFVWVPVWAALLFDIARRTRSNDREAAVHV